MVHQRRQVTEVTAQELRLLVDTNPGHPLASVFINAISGFAPDKKLFIEVADLTAFIDDTTPRLTTEDEIVNGERVTVETKLSS